MPASARPTVRLQFDRRPSAWHYMAGAFLPSPGLGPGRAFPDLSASWRDHHPSERDIADFARLSGAPDPGAFLPALYPHASAFRLQMAMLTHPVFPVPIWRVLQVRNQLLQARTIPRQAVLDYECRVHDHRVLDKGLEIDLHTAIVADGALAAESVNTFYVRGRFGAPGSGPAPDAPAAGGDTVANWDMPGGEGWRFGALTGDYNGIHMWSPYARAFGFKRSFFHPLRVLGHGLAHAGLPLHTTATQLSVWLKGPVYHGSQVDLRVRRTSEGTVLAMIAGGETRPAIVAQVREVEPRARLVAAVEEQTPGFK